MEIPFLAVLFSLFFNLMRGVQKRCLKNLEQKRGGRNIQIEDLN